MLRSSEVAASSIASTWTLILDVLGGASIGTLLGILVGLSVSPVVSTVVTGLVALLGALFGLASAAGASLGASGIVRLVAFGVAASIALPIAVSVRTHGALSPSISEDKALLESMGYPAGSLEQRTMLRYLRFGLLPPNASADAIKDSQPSARSSSGASDVITRDSALFAGEPQSVCDNLQSISSLTDLLSVLNARGPFEKTVGRSLRVLPAGERPVAVKFARIYLCGDAG